MVAAPESRHGLGVALVLLGSGAASSAGILLRHVERADDWQILFYRSLSFALTILVFLLFRHRGGTVAAFRAVGWNGVVVALALGGAMIVFLLALARTTVAETVFILSISPLLAGVIGRVVLGEAVRKSTWLAITVAVAGVGIMFADGLAVGGGRPLGNLLALGASLGFAITLVAMRRGRAVDMTPAACLAGVVAAIATCFVVTGLVLEAKDLMLALALGVGQLGMQYICLTAATRYVPAAEVAVLSLTEIVLAPIWVWIGIGEVPTGWVLFGGVVVLAAVAGQAAARLRQVSITQ